MKRILPMILVTLLAAGAALPAAAGGYGHGYHYSYGHHGHGDEGAALLAGLVIGGLVGYFISEDRHTYRERQVYDYHHRPHYHTYPRHRHVVVTERVAVEPVTLARREFAACQMTREYTTRVEIDGKLQEAYGTTCLRPDGSWELGRPQLVPDFD